MPSLYSRKKCISDGFMLPRYIFMSLEDNFPPSYHFTFVPSPSTTRVFSDGIKWQGIIIYVAHSLRIILCRKRGETGALCCPFHVLYSLSTLELNFFSWSLINRLKSGINRITSPYLLFWFSLGLHGARFNAPNRTSEKIYHIAPFPFSPLFTEMKIFISFCEIIVSNSSVHVAHSQSLLFSFISTFFKAKKHRKSERVRTLLQQRGKKIQGKADKCSQNKQQFFIVIMKKNQVEKFFALFLRWLFMWMEEVEEQK